MILHQHKTAVIIRRELKKKGVRFGIGIYITEFDVYKIANEAAAKIEAKDKEAQEISNHHIMGEVENQEQMEYEKEAKNRKAQDAEDAGRITSEMVIGR